MRLPRRGWRPGKSRVDDREQRLGVGRLGSERSAKGTRQGASFGFDIGGGSKHHPRLGEARLRAQVQHKLTSVHAWHQNVDEHEIGFFSPDDPQRSLAVGSLQQAVAAVLEQAHHEAAIDGALLDDKDCGHEVRPGIQGGVYAYVILTIDIRKEMKYQVGRKGSGSRRRP